MSKCKYLGDNGICEALSDNTVIQPCLEGPCGILAYEEVNHLFEKDKAEILSKWENTRQPRFSEAEREALDRINDTCTAYLHNYRFSTEEYVKIYGAIATVREMLGDEKWIVK